MYKNNTPTIAELVSHEPGRLNDLAWRHRHWLLDYTRVSLNRQEHGDLLMLPEGAGLRDAIKALFAGQIVNPSEQQPALHMALRAARPADIPGADPHESLLEQRDTFLDLAERLHRRQDGLTDLVHIGIGGSDLGPRLVAEALDSGDTAPTVHWLSTLDSRRLRALLNRLNPATTGLVIASKSFATEETLIQATALRDWLGAHFQGRAWAATARPDRALAFGLSEQSILPFPQWTGGRFSLWSSVGVSAAASIGRARFEALLAGAEAADRDLQALVTRSAPHEHLAVRLALVIHHWRRQQGLMSLGVMAYEPRLALLGDYLQQLIMESLGKGVDLADRPLVEPTSPLVYGGRGTDCQHALFQAFHQGLDVHPQLLVGALEDDQADPHWQRTQLAHLLGQAQALVHGRHDGRSCQFMPGNRPVALLLTQKLDAEGLGYLLASFEHAVFCLATLWQINAFDQWGVEEGKRLAARFAEKLVNEPPTLDDFPAAGFFARS